MPTPHDLLHHIRMELDSILEQPTILNAQQLTFVQHIHTISDAQHKQFEPMPSSAYALQRIIPTMSESLLQQQSALFGYAKLLLEHPESFDGVAFPDVHRAHIERISHLGQQLYHLTEHIQQSALTERQTQQNRSAVHFDVATLLEDEMPVLRYFLRDKAIQLSNHSTSLAVCASPYHLSAFIQHIILTVADELIEYGHIQLKTDRQALHIFCTGIQLTQADIDTLFTKQGRYVYPRRFEKEGGTITFAREQGRGSSIILAPSGA